MSLKLKYYKEIIDNSIYYFLTCLKRDKDGEIFS